MLPLTNVTQGLAFATPFFSNNSAFVNWITTYLPDTSAFPSTVSYISDTLYPPIFDGTQAMGYTNQIARGAAIISESTFTCNTFYLDKAFANKTYSYYFSVPPALHGEDVAYTYYNGGNDSSVIVPEVAIALQDYITSFAETGSPNREGVPFFRMYGPNATVQELGAAGVSQRKDTVANYRCNWWQKALYY